MDSDLNKNITYNRAKELGIISDYDPRISRPSPAILYSLTEGAIRDSVDTQKRTLATYDRIYKPWQNWFYGQKGSTANKQKAIWTPNIQRVVQAANRFGDITDTREQALLAGKRGLLNSVRDHMAYKPALRLAEVMRRKPGETVFDKAYQLALKSRPDLPSYFK